MPAPRIHPMMPASTHDETAEQMFVVSLKSFLYAEMDPVVRKLTLGVADELGSASRRAPLAAAAAPSSRGPPDLPELDLLHARRAGTHVAGCRRLRRPPAHRARGTGAQRAAGRHAARRPEFRRAALPRGDRHAHDARQLPFRRARRRAGHSPGRRVRQGRLALQPGSPGRPDERHARPDGHRAPVRDLPRPAAAEDPRDGLHRRQQPGRRRARLSRRPTAPASTSARACCATPTHAPRGSAWR